MTLASRDALVSPRRLSLVLKYLNKLDVLDVRSKVKEKFPSADKTVSGSVSSLINRSTRELGSVVPLTMRGLRLVKAGRVI